MEIFDPPCMISDVISQFFNFNNLQNYLKYLEDKDKKAFSDIYDLTIKVNDLLSMKEDIKELYNRFDLVNVKQEEMNNTLNFYGLKILDMESNDTVVKEV